MGEVGVDRVVLADGALAVEEEEEESPNGSLSK